MTPQIFKDTWTNTDGVLLPLDKSRLDRFNFSKATFNFLNIAGLPIYCEPNLSFANNTDDIVYGINKLTEQYDFEESRPIFDKYVVIGSCRDGDAIAIDTEDNNKVVKLDHEDSFSSMYFNSSVEALADFIIFYRDFEREVLKDKDPGDNFQCFNFTNEQFERLKSSMYSVDSKALTERGFWKEELEIMLSMRQEKYGTN